VVVESACGGAVGSSAAKNGAPFFMFTTSRFADDERDGVFAALREYVGGRDYLGWRLASEIPDVGKRLDRSHLYVLPASLKAVSRQSADCGAGAGLILYDGENWAETPSDEQANMPAAISRAKGAAKAAGCAHFGISPGGEMVGIIPDACSFDLSKAIHRHVDWADITLFNIQAQRLLSDQCNGRAGVKAYVKFVSTVAQEVHAKNPLTKISAQLSFRYTPPSRMIDAIRQLRGTVDGFYLAYPRNVGGRCDYCSSQNLQAVLKDIRSM